MTTYNNVHYEYLLFAPSTQLLVCVQNERSCSNFICMLHRANNDNNKHFVTEQRLYTTTNLITNNVDILNDKRI